MQKLLEEMPFNFIRSLAHAPTCIEPVLRLGTAVLKEQQLAANLRELMVLHVARLSSAEYEWVQHVPIARHAGVRPDQIKAIENGTIVGPAFSDREHAILAFTTEVVASAGCSDDVYRKVESFLEPREIVELTIAIGFYMLAARVMVTTQIENDLPADQDTYDQIVGRRWK